MNILTELFLEAFSHTLGNHSPDSQARAESLLTTRGDRRCRASALWVLCGPGRNTGKTLGYTRISVLEFGVAGGRGLLNLEYHAQPVESLLSIEIDVYGFDAGE